MPLVRISMLKGRAREERRRIGDAVHQALVETIAVPAKDRFQLIAQHDADDFVYDAEYLGVERTPDLAIIQVTLSAGRPVEPKRRLYQRIAERLGAEAGLRAQDSWINLVEVPKENWSFGNGIASYAPEESMAA